MGEPCPVEGCHYESAQECYYHSMDIEFRRQKVIDAARAVLDAPSCGGHWRHEDARSDLDLMVTLLDAALEQDN